MLSRSTPLHSLIPFTSHTLCALLIPVIGYVLGGPALTWWLIPLAIIFGNLPDIDSGTSRIGRLIPPLSTWIEANYGHRTVTHSLWPVLIIAWISWSSSFFIPWQWWLPAAMIGSHLILDMIVGTTGVPLLWPSPVRYYLIRRIKANSIAERIITIVLLALVFTLTIFGAPNLGAMITNAAGSLDYAIYQYREWEPTHQVLIEIEGTEQLTHQPVTGRYLVRRVEGNTFFIQINDAIRTAGQAQQEIYLRHVVAVQGSLRAGPVEIPTVTPTPVIVTIRVDHVSDPETEILVQVGDQIQPGTLLADLKTLKTKLKSDHKPLTIGDLFQRTATPTPLPTATLPPPTPTEPPSINPLEIDRADAMLQIAIAQATAAAERAYPDSGSLLASESALALRARELQQAQSAYDQKSWQSNIAMQPEALALERTTNNYNLAAARATTVAKVDYQALELANAKLQQDYIDHQRRIATPTPRNSPTPTKTATPTRTPTPTRTATPRPVLDPTEVEIRSLIAGTVVNVQIVSINGNEATVQISVQLPAQTTNTLATKSPNIDAPTTDYRLPAADSPATAQVLSVADGDTLDVRFADGRQETIRLLDVDTPETVHPTQPVECGGPEASQHTKLRLCGNTTGRSCTNQVQLETAGRGKYGRLLAYVWIDGILFNEELVAQGLARHDDYGEKHQYTERIAEVERVAQASEMGIWEACAIEH